MVMRVPRWAFAWPVGISFHDTTRAIADFWQSARAPTSRPSPVLLSGGQLGHTPALDGLRGLACGAVLLEHCLTGILKIPHDTWIWTVRDATFWLLLGGVDLFFVLSGFLIGGLLLDSKERKAGTHFFKNFWIRRVARIFPVAYLLLATYVVASFVTTRFNITRFDTWLLAANPASLWNYVTFTQNVPMAFAGYHDKGPLWMVPTWSLAIEEQFYLLFPLLVYFMRRKWLVVLIVCGIVAAPVMRDLVERGFADWFAAYVLSPSRLDGLLFGVAVALIVRHQPSFDLAVRYRRLLDAVALLLLFLIVTDWRCPFWPERDHGDMYPLKFTFLAIMWAVLVLRVFTYQRSFLNRIWCNWILVKIGLISYGVYMYNEVVNGLVHGLLFNQEPMIKTPEQLLAGFAVAAITFGLAAISFVYLERPIRRYGAAVAKGLSRDGARAKVLAGVPAAE